MSAGRIGVLGLGNLMRTDDAVGMLAVERLRRDFRLPPEVVIVEGGTLGLDLLYPLQGATHLLALDAVETGAAPGTLLRFEDDAVRSLPMAKSVHLLGFADLLDAMRLMGSAPRKAVVLGVQPEIIGWGTALSKVAAAALPRLVEAAAAQVATWRVETTTPELPLPLCGEEAGPSPTGA